jgi:hypothetical protein
MSCRTISLSLICLALCACATTEVRVIENRLKDPLLTVSERENLLERKEAIALEREGFRKGDAAYVAHILSQLRRDPNNAELEEKLHKARRDAYNEKKKTGWIPFFRK